MSMCECEDLLDNGNTFLNSLVTVNALPLGGTRDVWLTMSGHHGPVCACTAQSLGMMCSQDAAMVMAAGGLLVLHCYHPAYPVLRAVVLACSQAPCNSRQYAALSSILPLPFPIFFPPQPICPPWVENQNQTRITIPNPSPHLTSCCHPSHPCHTWPLLPVAATGRVGPGIAQRRRPCHHALHPPTKI